MKIVSWVLMVGLGFFTVKGLYEHDKLSREISSEGYYSGVVTEKLPDTREVVVAWSHGEVEVSPATQQYYDTVKVGDTRTAQFKYVIFSGAAGIVSVPHDPRISKLYMLFWSWVRFMLFLGAAFYGLIKYLTWRESKETQTTTLGSEHVDSN